MDVLRGIISLQELGKIKLPREKRVLVGGCFDILHIGHVRFLQASKEEGDIVIVALESDAFIRKYKNREPFHTQKERAQLLLAIRYVDVVILLPLMKNDRAYFELVQQVKPTLIAITEGDTQIDNKKKQAKTIGGHIKIVIPQQKNTSSTALLSFFSKDKYR